MAFMMSVLCSAFCSNSLQPPSCASGVFVHEYPVLVFPAPLAPSRAQELQALKEKMAAAEEASNRKIQELAAGYKKAQDYIQQLMNERGQVGAAQAVTQMDSPHGLPVARYWAWVLGVVICPATTAPRGG